MPRSRGVEIALALSGKSPFPQRGVAFRKITSSVPAPVVITKLAPWGDSITFGNQDGSGWTWPKFIDQAITSTIDVQNFGISGQRSTQISARQIADTSYNSGPTTAAIFAAGRNDLLEPDPVNALLTGTAAMVAHLSAGARYLVLSVHTNVTEGTSGTDQADYATVISMNSQLASIYGANFLDTRRYLIDNGLAINGLTASAGDLADIAKDTIPRSLLMSSDGIHLNQYGYRAMAICILNKMVALGWIASYSTPAIPAPYSPPAPAATMLLHYDAMAQTAADGATLMQLNDLSGSGNHATRVGGTGQVTYDIDGQNGKPAFDFPGTVWFETPTFPAITGVITAFVVHKQDIVGSTRYIFTSPTDTSIGYGTVSTGGAWLVMRGSLLSVGVADTLPHVARLVLGVGAGASSLYLDGNQIATASNAGVGQPTKLRFGANSAGVNLNDGKLAEVLIYNGALTPTEIANKEAELIAKWTLVA